MKNSSISAHCFPIRMPDLDPCPALPVLLGSFTETNQHGRNHYINNLFSKLFLRFCVRSRRPNLCDTDTTESETGSVVGRFRRCQTQQSFRGCQSSGAVGHVRDRIALSVGTVASVGTALVVITAAVGIALILIPSTATSANVGVGEAEGGAGRGRAVSIE